MYTYSYMRRVLVLLLWGKVSILTLCLVATGAYIFVLAYMHGNPPAPVHIAQYVLPSEAPVLAARSFVVVDVATGEVIAAQAAEEPYPIASVTKLVAAAAAEDVLPMEATTTITSSDVASEGRAGKLAASQRYTYRELLFPLLLESSNDAAATLERVEGEELLLQMHEVARRYGAATARFADASGLSSENVASAYDLAKIAAGIRNDHPFVLAVTSLPQYIGPYTGWVNNSPVGEDPQYVGGKHGYTEAAGRTIVALFDEKFEGGTRTLGYVVLGSDDLRSDVATLRSFVQAEVRFE